MAEFGEEMVAAWLRFQKGCLIVECGWRLTPQLILAAEEALTDPLVEIWRQAEEALLVPGLERPDEQRRKRILQTLRQMELDVMGYRSAEGDEPQSYLAVECAFHMKGLRYGTGDRTEDNAARVGKKAFVIVFAAVLLKLPVSNFYLVSPKLDDRSRDGIQAKLNAVRTLFHGQLQAIELTVIANEDLRTEVLVPLRNIAPELGTTGNSFIRAIQILQGVELGGAQRRANPRAQGQAAAPAAIANAPAADGFPDVTALLHAPNQIVALPLGDHTYRAAKPAHLPGDQALIALNSGGGANSPFPEAFARVIRAIYNNGAKIVWMAHSSRWQPVDHYDHFPVNPAGTQTYQGIVIPGNIEAKVGFFRTRGGGGTFARIMVVQGLALNDLNDTQWRQLLSNWLV